ncbi:hypothetical protein Ahy_A07g036961 [Arachis hypogaea]|uniref:Transposase MuDR plant domain-containing protein n=1 Tax=Arachis hypogaea TaxID=3818 RepID=A0A445CHG2_ARAHY|nr:hypothetical protein Ahy_A07g036961 [Arachis hypogaea]
MAIVVVEIPIVSDDEFSKGMEFSSRKVVIMAMKHYTIHRIVDYLYGSSCDWLIRVSMIHRKYYWIIKRYNGSHICTRATICQDHSKLDSNTIAKTKASKLNYTISYRKVWLAKQKSVKKYLEVGKHRIKVCPYGLRPCVIRSHQQSSI